MNKAFACLVVNTALPAQTGTTAQRNKSATHCPGTHEDKRVVSAEVQFKMTSMSVGRACPASSTLNQLNKENEYGI